MPANDWFVNGSVPSSGTGQLQDPFATITEALDAAADGDRILVAPGRYAENLVVAKDLTLVGTGGRDVTIIDGGRAESVVRHEAGTMTLRGVTLTNGRSFLNGGGGGISVSSGYLAPVTTLWLVDSTVSANVAYADAFPSGGGIYVGRDTSVTIVDSTIHGNRCSAWDGAFYSRASGGGIQNEGGTVRIERSVIRNNVLDEPGSGKAIWNSGTLTLVGSLVTGHDSNDCNSAIDTRAGVLTLESSTIAGNDNNGCSFTGPIFADGPVVVKNSIVWENTGTPFTFDPNGSASVAYSDIEGGWPGVGNIDVHPYFDYSYGLQYYSACIDAGDPRDVPGGVDALGNPRLQDGTLDRGLVVDMGAYEFSNVRLEVTVPRANEVQLDVSGTSGLEVFLAVGTAFGETLFPAWGSALIDLATLRVLAPLGASPVSATFRLPRNASLHGESALVLQALALAAPIQGRRPGNWSNAVTLEF